MKKPVPGHCRWLGWDKGSHQIEGFHWWYLVAAKFRDLLAGNHCFGGVIGLGLNVACPAGGFGR